MKCAERGLRKFGGRDIGLGQGMGRKFTAPWACAISFRLLQNASSRQMLVLCPSTIMERLMIVDFMVAPSTKGSSHRIRTVIRCSVPTVEIHGKQHQGDAAEGGDAGERGSPDPAARSFRRGRQGAGPHRQEARLCRPRPN